VSVTAKDGRRLAAFFTRACARIVWRSLAARIADAAIAA
jgi:hypothetical protein